jgi:hypothetical protein
MIITIMADEERYSNRQIERLLDEQSSDIKGHIDLVTRPILDQVLKTNGRVTKNEDDIVKHKEWRGWIMGGLAVLSFFVTSLIGLQVWMVVQILHIPDRINQAIAAEVAKHVLTNDVIEK